MRTFLSTILLIATVGGLGAVVAVGVHQPSRRSTDGDRALEQPGDGPDDASGGHGSATRSRVPPPDTPTPVSDDPAVMPAGWYPVYGGGKRYWDGERWTDHHAA